MTYKEFDKKGYSIEVMYLMTEAYKASVLGRDLIDTKDSDDLVFNCEDVIAEEYVPDSEQYSVYDPDGKCLANDLDSVKSLQDFIKQL